MELQKEKEMNPIDAGKIYEHLEQVGALYPRYADNIVDNAVNNVIIDIKNFISSLQQEQSEVKLEKDKCLGCNNVKGCVTCVDGNQWAHISEVEDEGELGRGPHTESWLESVKKELQHEEELLDMRLDTLRRIREKKNLFQQGRPEEDFETEYAKFSNDPNALDYALPIDLADYKDFARHFYKLGLKARKED